MSERLDLEPFDPPTPEERAEAARLRDRLEEGTGELEADVAGTVALLGVASGAPLLDDLAARRLRRELAGAASRNRFRPLLRGALRVAAAALVGAFLVQGRLPRVPDAAILEEREAMAREAVALVTSRLPSGSVSRSALASLTASRTEALFAEVESERLVGASGDTGAADGAISPTPVPGGAS